MGDWYYTETGDPRTKVPWNDLVDLFQKGIITSKTYVWQKKQVKDWTQLSRLPHILKKLENNIKDDAEPGSRSRGGHRSKKTKSKQKKKRGSSSRNRSSHSPNVSALHSGDKSNNNNNNNNNENSHHSSRGSTTTSSSQSKHHHANGANFNVSNNFRHSPSRPRQPQTSHNSHNNSHNGHNGHNSHNAHNMGHEESGAALKKHNSKSPSLSQSITEMLTDSNNDSELSDTANGANGAHGRRGRRNRSKNRSNHNQNETENTNGSGSGRKRTPMDTPVRHTPRDRMQRGLNTHSPTPQGRSNSKKRSTHLGVEAGQQDVGPGANETNHSNNSYGYDRSNGTESGGEERYNEKHRINLMEPNVSSPVSSTYRSHRSGNTSNTSNNNNNNNMASFPNTNGMIPNVGRSGSYQSMHGYNAHNGHNGHHAPHTAHGGNDEQNRQRRGKQQIQIGQILRVQRGSIVMEAAVTNIGDHEIQVMYEDNQGEWLDTRDTRILSIEPKMSDNPEFYRQPSVTGKMMKNIKPKRGNGYSAHDGYKQSFDEKDNSPTTSQKSDENGYQPRPTHPKHQSHTRGTFTAGASHQGHQGRGERRMSTTMLHDIAKAASDAIQLRDQQRMLEVERERFEREKREFSIYKEQVKQEYEMRKYEYDEQIRTYVAKKQLYSEALKRMEKQDLEYSKSIRMHLDFQKLEEKRRSIKRRFKDIRTMHEKAYNLLEIIRNETIRLNALRKKYASKCKEMHGLINDKNEQHKQFVEEMHKIKKEMLYLPWLVMGSDKTSKPNMEFDEIRAELLKGWEELERERNKWDVVRRKVEKKSVLITSYQSEEKMLVTVRKKLDNARLYEKEWKQKMLQDINKMVESQTGQAIDEKLLNIHKQEIELECSKQSLKDDQRHLEQEQELLALQHKHLNEQILDVEKTREVVDAKQAQLNAMKIMGGSKAQSGKYDDAQLKRMTKQKDQKIEALSEELILKREELSEKALELERQKGECLKLQMQLAEEQKRKTELSKEEERKALKGFVIQFQEEIQKYHKQNVSLQIQVKVFKDKFEENEKVTKEINNEKNELEEKMKGLEEEKKELVEKTRELNEYCALLEDHNKEVEQQFKDILHANIQAVEEQNHIRKKHISNQKSLDFAAVKMKNLSVDFSAANTPRGGSSGASSGGSSAAGGAGGAGGPPNFSFHKNRNDSTLSLQSRTSNELMLSGQQNFDKHNRTLTGPPPFATKLANLDSNGTDEPGDTPEDSKEDVKEGQPSNSKKSTKTPGNNEGTGRRGSSNLLHVDAKDKDHRITGTVLLHDIDITPHDTPSVGGDSPPGATTTKTPAQMIGNNNNNKHKSVKSNESTPLPLSNQNSESEDKKGAMFNINKVNGGKGKLNKSASILTGVSEISEVASVNSIGEDGDAFLQRMASQLARQDPSKHNLLDKSMSNLTDFAKKVSMDFNLKPNKNFDFMDDLEMSDDDEDSDFLTDDDSDNGDLKRSRSGKSGSAGGTGAVVGRPREESLNMDAIEAHIKKLEQKIDENNGSVLRKLEKLENNGKSGGKSGKNGDKKGSKKKDSMDSKHSSSNGTGTGKGKDVENKDKKRINKNDNGVQSNATEDLAYAMVENGWVGPHDLLASPGTHDDRDDRMMGGMSGMGGMGGMGGMARNGGKNEYEDDQIDSDYLDSDDLDKDDGYQD